MYIAAHASWNYPREWYMQTPDPVLPIEEKEIYKNPIVLLVNATTFSSAENFCVLFRGAKRGKSSGLLPEGVQEIQSLLTSDLDLVVAFAPNMNWILKGMNL